MMLYDKVALALVAFGCLQTLYWAIVIDQRTVALYWKGVYLAQIAMMNFHELEWVWLEDHDEGWDDDVEYARAKRLCELASDLPECQTAYRQFMAMKYDREPELVGVLFDKWDILAWSYVNANPDWAALREQIEHMRYQSPPWKEAKKRLDEGRANVW